MNKKSRIFIAGHEGLVGQALLLRLSGLGFTNLFTKNVFKLDLADQKALFAFFKKKRIEYCFLPSIREGGIGVNISLPAELIYENLLIQTNVIHCAWQARLKKLLFFASSCVYPKDCLQPMKEEYLLTGKLEATNEAYALAKIAGIKMCQAYNRQYNTKFISVIPATAFGPNDNFDPRNSHVIPALIHKFHEAKIKNRSVVSIWGSGRPRREFIYVNDLADICIFLMRSSNSTELINAGTGIDVSVKKLAELLKKITAFKGSIKFDIKKPDGVKRKLLDISRLTSLGWRSKANLQSSLEETYRWYLKHKR